MEEGCRWIVVVLAVVAISGCTHTENTFSDILNDVNETPYKIHVFNSISSSGGGTVYNETRDINSTELKETVDELTSMNVVGSFMAGNRKCFYNSGPSPNYFACLVGDMIVNYVKKDGPSYYRWNAEGYDLDIPRSTVIDSISDLKRCDTDTDCTLTSSGVCDSTGQCATTSDCDPGCRTAINVKYFVIWDFVPLIEDQCITDRCAAQNEYFVASCIDHVCSAKIASSS